MKPSHLICLVFLAPGLAGGQTTPVTSTVPVLPPAIQKAQNEVYQLEFQMYQAQHDLAIAQINQNEQDLQNQKNTNPAYASQYSELFSKLEMERSDVENRYSLAQQWYHAVQIGDFNTAQSIQQQMNQK